jgi:anti-anti-sigma factor
MEIQNIQHGGYTEVTAAGRLDEYWATHLESHLQQVIRGGVHRIRLNMAEVTYLSSAGIRILLQCFKQLIEINGSFGVIQPSVSVRRILDMTKLSTTLILEPGDARAADAPAPFQKAVRRIERKGSVLDVLDTLPGASMRCRAVGDPRLVENAGYGEKQVQKLSFPVNTMGIGLGAFGGDFADCKTRFGEFLAVAGAAAYLPTDGSNVPDYMVSAGSFVPEINVLYGLACEGDFAHLARFESSGDTRGVRMSDLVEVSLEIAGAEAVVLAVVAETTGLVGAALRRSPALGMAAAAPFSHPEIRKWISFTAEPAFAGSLAVVAGVAARRPGAAYQPFLRSLGTGTSATGHFHGAALSYLAMRKDQADLRSTVSTLFEGRVLQGLLHLLADGRPGGGAGESEFVRGACWIAPLRGMEAV